MLRPEESSYPTPEKEFEETKLALERGVADGKFTFLSNDIVKSPKLDEWLLAFGWKLIIAESFGERESIYYKLEPLNA